MLIFILIVVYKICTIRIDNFEYIKINIFIKIDLYFNKNFQIHYSDTIIFMCLKSLF